MSDKDSFENLYSRIHELLAPCFAEDWPLLPVERMEGIHLHTLAGERIMDFTAGIAVSNVGHCHPQIVQAAKSQIDKMIHGAVGLTVHESVLQFSQALGEVTPDGLNMFFFGNSGSEAIEGAIKMARYVTKKPGIIALSGGFHGRTYGAASISTIKAKYRNYYEPHLPAVYFASYPYPYRCPMGPDPTDVIAWSMESLYELFDHQIPQSQVAAIVVEPVQGEGGYIVPPDGYLSELRRLCDDNDILLVFDEIQTGFGRTGQMFAAQTFDVRPDIMAIAKGIAGGFPLSATVSTPELMRRWEFGSHGTTYGGSPVSCAAGLAALTVIHQEGLLENCRARGVQLLEGLLDLKKSFDTIGEVRGIGLMVAVEFIHPGDGKKPNGAIVKRILQEMLDRGLLAYSAGTRGQVIRFMPPLIATEEQIDRAIAIFRESVREAS